MPDQMRGDCLSLARHPVILTPNIDEIGGRGVHFTRAYTTCASCIAARRSLLTGQFPATNGMVGYRDGYRIKVPTFPQKLLESGYQTALVGRSMHQYPSTESYGYEKRVLGSTYVEYDDYAEEIAGIAGGTGGVKGHGISFNGWTAKPWHLEEYLHPTNWVARQSRELLASLDSNRPLFLTTSFYAPHPPLVPPAFYIERYLRMDLPDAAIGNWAIAPENDGLGLGIDSHRTVLKGEALRSAQAGYFGLINHIDDQLYWLVSDFKTKSVKAKRPWIIIFTSDHGEMLGDHYHFRKCEPYEGSSRIPLLIQGSPEMEFTSGQTCDTPVCLEDLMPTLLDLSGVEVPENVDGKSLLPILRGEKDMVHKFLHGEHSPCYSGDQAYHFITDGRVKHIWRPQDGTEQFFDLDEDPAELHDLINDVDRKKEIEICRSKLIKRLRGRPEGFTDGRKLISGRPYNAILPCIE